MAAATQPIDPIIARIREEGMTRSQIDKTLDHLCNVIGPRLTGSPRLTLATEWTRDQLEKWGLTNAHFEEWGPFGRGWTVERFSMQVTAPYTISIIGYPKGWSPGFEQPLEASVIHLDAAREEDLEKYRGKLKDQIVLIGAMRAVEARFEPMATRQTDERLARLEAVAAGVAASSVTSQAEPAAERRARFAETSRRGETLMGRSGGRGATTRRAATTTTTPATATSPTSGPASAPTSQEGRSLEPLTAKMLTFAAAEGAALVATPSAKGDGGTFFVTGASIPNDPPRNSGEPTTRPRVWSANVPPMPAQLMLSIEDYNRLVRITRAGETVKAVVDLRVKFHGDGEQMQRNTIAEIAGSDLRDEIVMVGGHLDSWHSGSGATDNAVGASAAMEAVRIIKALGLKPRRTIRVALWTGEEEGILGSSAYVKKHFGYIPEDQPATQRAAPEGVPSEPPGGVGNPATQPASTTKPTARDLVKLPDYEKLSVYFNLDNGTGKIRGIYTQGNAGAVPIFREWLRPFHDLGAKTVTLANTAATDHIPFDRVGLPGFQFIQDPIEYSPRTHHSNQDTFDRIQMEDMKQNATIMAAFVWQAANMDERFPRKPMPPATQPAR